MAGTWVDLILIKQCELIQSASSPGYLEASVGKDSSYKQLAHVTNRVLSDLEARGGREQRRRKSIQKENSSVPFMQM